MGKWGQVGSMGFEGGGGFHASCRRGGGSAGVFLVQIQEVLVCGGEKW